MNDQTPTPVFLKDYAPAPQAVGHVDMVVQLHAAHTRVETRLHVTVRQPGQPLVLDGEGLGLVSAQIDGREVQPIFKNDQLHFDKVPNQNFILTLVQTCNPQANTALSGLYLSNGVFCTQMEAQGFRRFAFMQDRPDVMATYTVRIEAPTSLPVLLGNGNPVAHGPMGDERHFATWDDPFPKPTYLFAIVAGALASVHDRFTTADGREVALGIYVEHGKEDRCAWAMECLKQSMRWDEQRFGLSYDLSVFNIVAVSDFNMGAMENKGLNIFNDKYILARPDTATDADYVNIERIIAHEYFHNWTGNRITCRDWFQLCLKEGLTVFRDQEFTSDLRSRAVKRIDDVKTLRARQFPEDQGPLAHAVRPESYIEINNFYTPTVYEKGAEICRMLMTLIGRDGFRKGMDLFVARHDGEAAVVEDFLRCMADASGRDLAQFAMWYAQAGTPIVNVTTAHDAATRTYTIQLAQQTPDTPGQSAKPPLHVPLAMGLMSPSGKALALPNNLVELTSETATLTFHDMAERPVLSINRGFSTPVILRTDATEADLLVQLAHDSDSFNCWEAGQTLARRMLLAAYRGERYDTSGFAGGLRNIIVSNAVDDAFKAHMLGLPGEAEVTAALGTDVDATRVHNSRTQVISEIAAMLTPELAHVLQQHESLAPYVPDAAGVARRTLRYGALSLLARADAATALQTAQKDFAQAANMTTAYGSLSSVLMVADLKVDDLLQEFYQRHADDPLIVDKWFLLMAARPALAPANRIRTLMQHPAFTLKTPNRVYALVGGFAGGNLSAFHADDGSGYELLADVIIALNSINPQVASRMATSLRSWKLYEAGRQSHARLAMQRILATPGLSNDVFEIISRTLG